MVSEQIYHRHYRKAIKNDKLLHEVKKLTRQNNINKLNKLLAFLEEIEKLTTFKCFLKTNSELTVDDDLVLKSNRIVMLFH